MTARVLMNKKTGDLLEGHRVSLFDKRQELALGERHSISLEIFQRDGWIIYHPEMSTFFVFFNNNCEQWMEDLGEL